MSDCAKTEALIRCVAKSWKRRGIREDPLIGILAVGDRSGGTYTHRPNPSPYECVRRRTRRNPSHF